MQYLSLFSGIGGLDLAAHWAGFSPVAFVERDAFCQKVLAKHWPCTPIFDDVRTFNAAQFLGITLIIGGFPCQDISAAGKGAGLEGERSGLWFEYLRIIKECKPRFIVAENVFALLGRGLDRVLCDLEEAGYAAEAISVAASDLGAPHQRKRWFIVGERNDMADTESLGQWEECQDIRQGGREINPLDHAGSTFRGDDRPGNGESLANSNGQRQPQPSRLDEESRRRTEHGGEELEDADSARPSSQFPQESHEELSLYPTGASSDPRALGASELGDSTLGGIRCGWTQGESGLSALSDKGVTELDNADRDGCQYPESRTQTEQDRDGADDGLHSAGSGDRASQLREHARRDGLGAGMGGAAHGLSSGMDFPGLLWPAGKGAYQHDWEAPRTVQGKQPGRPARIKVLGNAVVPAQALPVFIAIRQRIEETQASADRFGMLEIED